MESSESLTFEEGLERLEAIVCQMEEASMPLTETLAAYEKGIHLQKTLLAMLEGSEKQLELALAEEETP